MSQSNRSEHKDKILGILRLAAWGLFAAPLVGYAVMGSFMRINGDDYCFGMVLTQNGFWKAQVYSYLHVTVYHSNRYLMTLLSHVSDLLGPRSAGLYPGLAIAGWVTGLAWSLNSLRQWLGWGLGRPESILMAQAIVFFALYQTHALSEVLYWRAGMLGYLAPFVFNSLLLGMVFAQMRRSRFSWMVAVLVFLFAVLAGGGSETATAVQFWFWALLVAVLVWSRRRGLLPAAEAGAGLKLAAAALTGTVVAILLLVLAPNTLRLMRMSEGELNLIADGLTSIRYAYGFILGTLSGSLLPNLVNLVLFGLLGLLSEARRQALAPLGHPVLPALSSRVYLLFVYLAGFVMITSSIAPTVIATGLYPSQRVFFVPGAVLVVLVSATGWFLGKTSLQVFRSRLPGIAKLQPLVIIFTLVMILLMGAYPVYTTRKITADYPKFNRWAVYWDRRDRAIRAAKAGGMPDLEIMVIDHILPNIAELNDQPHSWYNGCAASYYGVSSITANQPGWDDD